MATRILPTLNFRVVLIGSDRRSIESKTSQEQTLPSAAGRAIQELRGVRTSQVAHGRRLTQTRFALPSQRVCSAGGPECCAAVLQNWLVSRTFAFM